MSPRGDDFQLDVGAALRFVRTMLPSLLWLGLATGCGDRVPRWPFPDVDAHDDGAVIRTLKDRTAGVRTLYATLSMSFEMPEHSAVAETVVHYRRPGVIRMKAFKDLFVSSRDLFDLLITPERFAMRLDTETGPERRDGKSSELGRLYPGFRAIGALREAMFLPGLIESDAPPRVTRRTGAIDVETLTPAGFLVVWELDERTLGVRRANVHVSGSGAEITIEYRSYREVAGRFFPERFELRDAENKVTIVGALDDIELDPELADDVFTFSTGR